MLFFEKKQSKYSIIIRIRKYTLLLSTIPLFLHFIIFPIFNISQNNNIFWLITIVFGFWMSVEGIICGSTLKKYKKKGNKIEYDRSRYFNILKQAKIILK